MENLSWILQKQTNKKKTHEGYCLYLYIEYIEQVITPYNVAHIGQFLLMQDYRLFSCGSYGPTWHMECSCAMLAWPDYDNILQVIFLRKDEYVLWTKHCRSSCCAVLPHDVFRQLWLDDIPAQCWEPLGKHCTEL